MIEEAIKKIVNKEDLTYHEAYTVMNEIMNAKTTMVQNAAFLAALSTKTSKAETIDEITGCAMAMREHALPIQVNEEEIVEIVGTGGDHSHSFNVSTTAAIVCAAGGLKIAKHGNRAASSQCGTADCLEALGVEIQESPELVQTLLDKVGISFLFAQKYHTSMKYVAPIRKELGIRTVFNILGPLTNPLHPTIQLLGVYDAYLVEPLAKVLMQLGVKRGMVVYGMDSLDEISISAPTLVCEFQNGWYKTYTITPEQFGFTRAKKEDILGGSKEVNANITRSILNKDLGPKRDIVLLNAGALFYIANKTSSIEEGIDLAKEVIDSSKAKSTLEAWVKYSHMEDIS